MRKQIKICGITWYLIPVETEQQIDYTKQEIYFVVMGNNDYIIPDIIGKVFEVMLHYNGIENDKKRMSVDRKQFNNFIKYSIYCFLKDNDIDWKNISFKHTPLPLYSSKEGKEEFNQDVFDEISEKLERAEELNSILTDVNEEVNAVNNVEFDDDFNRWLNGEEDVEEFMLNREKEIKTATNDTDIEKTVFQKLKKYVGK